MDPKGRPRRAGDATREALGEGQRIRQRHRSQTFPVAARRPAGSFGRGWRVYLKNYQPRENLYRPTPRASFRLVLLLFPGTGPSPPLSLRPLPANADLCADPGVRRLHRRGPASVHPSAKKNCGFSGYSPPMDIPSLINFHEPPPTPTSRKSPEPYPLRF